MPVHNYTDEGFLGIFLKLVEIFVFAVVNLLSSITQIHEVIPNAGQAPRTDHNNRGSQKREQLGNNRMIFGLNPAHPQEPVPVGPLISQEFNVRIRCQPIFLFAKAVFKLSEPCLQGETGAFILSYQQQICNETIPAWVCFVFVHSRDVNP